MSGGDSGYFSMYFRTYLTMSCNYMPPKLDWLTWTICALYVIAGVALLGELVYNFARLLGMV